MRVDGENVLPLTFRGENPAGNKLFRTRESQVNTRGDFPESFFILRR